MQAHISGDNHGAPGGPVVAFNGHEIRVRQSEGFTLFPCGCGYYEREWGQMCAPAAAEEKALHMAALSRRAWPRDRLNEAKDWLSI